MKLFIKSFSSIKIKANSLATIFTGKTQTSIVLSLLVVNLILSLLWKLKAGLEEGEDQLRKKKHSQGKTSSRVQSKSQNHHPQGKSQWNLLCKRNNGKCRILFLQQGQNLQNQLKQNRGPDSATIPSAAKESESAEEDKGSAAKEDSSPESAN